MAVKFNSHKIKNFLLFQSFLLYIFHLKKGNKKFIINQQIKKDDVRWKKKYK